MGAGEFIAKNAPITGDIWDIYSGGRKVFDPNSTMGQRAIGLGQAGLGTLGLATLGVGSLAKSGVKLGVKQIAKYGAKKALTKTAQKQMIKEGANPILVGLKAGVKNMPYENAVRLNNLNTSINRGMNSYLNSIAGKTGALVNRHPYLTSLTPEVASLFLGREGASTSSSGSEDGENLEGNNQQQLQNQLQGGEGYYGGGYVPTGGQVNVDGITPEQANQIGSMINQTTPQRQDDARQLFYDYMIKQQAMQPYRDRLNDYINSYQRRSDQSYNQDKYLALLQSLTGAQGLGQLMGRYTSLGDEAKQIDLQKMQGEDLKSIGEGLDTLMGNVELARRLNLPLNSVNADKDFVKLAVTSDLNDEKLQQRMAIEQAKINAKFKLQQAQNAFKAAMKRGDRRGASQAQNQVKYWNAINRQIENGADPEEAVQWGNRQFGTTFSTPPSGSGMGSKILPM